MSYFQENETPPPPEPTMLPPAPEPQTIRTSAEVDKLVEAMAKANLTIENPAKDAENPHFRSRYADLAAGLKAIRKPLAQNGIVLFQVQRMTPEGLMLFTRLVHSSGQWIETEWPLGKAQGSPQAMGSNLTYGRRYSAFPLVGIAGEDDDDDGSGAQQQAPAQVARGRRPQPSGDTPAKASKPDAPSESTLPPDASAETLKGLLASLAEIPANDLAAVEKWGKTKKPSKAGLMPADLDAITKEFKTRRASAVTAQNAQQEAA